MVDAGPVPQLLHQAVGRFRALGDEKRLRLLAVLKDGDPMRFTTHGDAAPNDRFAFRYEGVEDPASRVEDWRSLSR